MNFGTNKNDLDFHQRPMIM